MARTKGWKRDLYDARDLRFDGMRMGASAQSPRRASLRAYAPKIRDQGPASSCTAFAVGYALATVQARELSVQSNVAPAEAVERTPFHAAGFAYWNARRYSGEENVDGGTYLRDTLRGVGGYGFCAEAAWPYDAARVNERPDESAYQAAYDQRVGLVYARIDATGDELVREVMRALASGWGVVWGTKVNAAFEAASAGDVFDAPEDGDGHAMCALEVDLDAPGGGVVRGPQSWSADYGDEGWYAVRPGYLASKLSGDFWAIKAAPLYLAR